MDVSKKILIIDDNEANLFSLKKILEKAELQIHTALSGIDGLRLACKNRYSLILLDIQMPVMDGFETLEKLRETELNTYTPVILISAIFTEDQYKIRGIKTGAVDFIPKPVNPEIIRAKVKVFITLEDQKYQLEDLVNELEKKNKLLKSEIKKRKKIENDLRIAKQNAERISDMKSKFLSNMSHEIRTPVNSILGFANLISNPQISEQDKERYVRYVSNSSQNLLFLINEILDHSRIEAGELKITYSNIDLDDLITELFESFTQIKKQMGKDNLKLIVETQDDAVRYCKSDLQRIRQVLINFLSNAVKYTEKGEIRFGYQAVKDKVRFYVRDTGLGIDKTSLESIFSRFTRIENEDNLSSQGTGLGLSIASRIIDLLDGDIGCSSELNVGSEFFFTIPFIAGEMLPKHEPSVTIDIEDPDWSKYTILIAEDEEMNFLFLKEALRSTGIQILWAENGIQAVEQTIQKNPNLVLMDVKMPDMNGFEAIKQIRNSNPAVPIVIQTAFAKNDDGLADFEETFDDFITKPINRTVLLKTLDKFLND